MGPGTTVPRPTYSARQRLPQPRERLRAARQLRRERGLDWALMAGIYSVESDFGRSSLPGVRSGESSAGAGGPGQFLSGT